MEKEEIKVSSEFTEQSTLGDLFENIELPIAMKNRFEKITSNKTEKETIGETLLTPGLQMKKEFGDKTYIELCHLLFEIGFSNPDNPLFSAYTRTILATINKTYFPKGLKLLIKAERADNTSAFFLLAKDLYTLNNLYYHAWENSDTIGKNFIIKCAHRIKRDYFLK